MLRLPDVYIAPGFDVRSLSGCSSGGGGVHDESILPLVVTFMPINAIPSFWGFRQQ